MEKCIITKVTIKGLWGVKALSSNFDENVNIFIGANGTSKTTFLNLIESTLLLDINTLVSIDFESIELCLKTAKINKITLKKQIVDDNPILFYSFNDDTAIEIACADLSRRYSRMPMKNRENYFRIKEIINEAIKISWLSVSRGIVNNFDEIENRRMHSPEIEKDLVDLKLYDLIKKLIVYQLQLESESNKLADKFKEDVFTLMLFNEEYDKYDVNNIQEFENVEPENIQKGLYQVFSKLGVARDKKNAITQHMEKLKSVIVKIKGNQTIEINDVFPLSLINRTLSLISISKENEEAKSKIFSPIDNYIKCIKQFISDKTFSISNDENGLNIELKYKKKDKYLIPIKISSLSSGEKQLIILLTETLLQRNEPYLFIADEPELSLHIDWQRKIIGSIKQLNPNAQIIFATHSPEIAGQWSQNVINMENITIYEE